MQRATGYVMVAVMAIETLDFRQAAVREATRYGVDPWVFLRELLQNSRDAGATRVTISTGASDDLEEVEVVDDGQGMTRNDAQRFLLTLYASSKSGSQKMAGVFGVGFWSVLVFEPDLIELRSRVAGQAVGWRLLLDGQLERIEESACDTPVGTSVRLARRRGREDLGKKVWAAVRNDARYLRRREQPEALIDVFVNGRRATESMQPGVPGISFRGPGMRGVVTLGEEPELTLLAHGLRVRTAASSDDLLVSPRRGAGAACASRSGLWPQVIVDSDRLAVLMARGDVAQDRELIRVARRVEKETRRLYRSELDRLAPLPPFSRYLGLIRENKGRTLGTLAGGLLIAVVVALASMMGLGGTTEEDAGSPTVGPVRQHLSERPFQDRSSAYEGPALDTVGGPLEAPELRYSPALETPALAAFRITGLDETGRPVVLPWEMRPASPAEFTEGQPIIIEAVVSGRGPVMRIPVPTGHAVDPGSVRVDGRSAELWYTAASEPAIQIRAMQSSRLTYRTRPARQPAPSVGPWPSLPEDVTERAAPLRRLQPARRVAGAIALVRELVSTRLDTETYERLRGARARGEPLIPSALHAGGGDCDVVNALLVSILDAVGLETRLAVGWIGAEGKPLPGYHAWAEVDLGNGEWVAADASTAVPRRALGDRRAETGEPTQVLGDAVGIDGETRFLNRFAIFGVAALVSVFFATVVFLVRGRSFRRRVILGVDPDPGRMVEIVLRDTGLSSDFSDARLRPMVPVLGGRRRSLAELDRSALADRLFAASGGGRFVELALKAGVLVIDSSTRAGKAAATALGATDIDRFSRLTSVAHVSDLAGRVACEICGPDVDVEILEAAGLKSSAESFRLPGVSRIHILVNTEGAEWRTAAGLLPKRPAEAVFRGVDLLARTLPDIGDLTKRAIGGVAREAVFEAAGGAR